VAYKPGAGNAAESRRDRLSMANQRACKAGYEAEPMRITVVCVALWDPCAYGGSDDYSKTSSKHLRLQRSGYLGRPHHERQRRD
jgi:hypothetical protein